MGKGKQKDEPKGEAKDKKRDAMVCASKDGACATEGAKHEEGKKAKAVKPKPKGMRWVSPYLVVRDVARSLAWYETAFGFQAAFTMPGPDGKIRHAEVRHERGVIMMGGEMPGTRWLAPGKDGSPVSIYCYCRDVDAVAASARAAGGTVAQEPADQFYGDRTCFIVDPDGHQWTFATHVFDMDPDAKMPEKACDAAAAPEEAKPAPKVAAAEAAPAKATAGASKPG